MIYLILVTARIIPLPEKWNAFTPLYIGAIELLLLDVPFISFLQLVMQ